ncbi:hypothetical protein ACQJBY_001532 [Aegilops geniculata]
MQTSADVTYYTVGNIVGMSLDERFTIMRSIGLESIDEDELRMLLEKRVAPICYVWCDPTPWVHIAQGIMMVDNVNKMVKAGCRVKILMADWFAYMLGKADLNDVQTIGCYMIEIWKAAGLVLHGVEFVWLSDEINSPSGEYWTLVMDIARNNTLRRTIRYCGIEEPPMEYRELIKPCDRSDVVGARVIHTCMQCAAILFQKADIWLLSMDQEEGRPDVSKLTREYCKDMKGENRPIILSHNKLPNLIEDHEFMKIDDPMCAIFMEDEEQDIPVKIRNAFCPAKVAKGNPCLEYIKHIVLPWFGYFEVPRKEENSGSRLYGATSLTTVKPKI